MKYKIITEIEITIEGGTEKTRNKLANDMSEAAILEGFATWEGEYDEMLGTLDPDGACACRDGWVLGAQFDTPCTKCNGDGRKIKSLSYDNYKYKIKKVTRINGKTESTKS